MATGGFDMGMLSQLLGNGMDPGIDAKFSNPKGGTAWNANFSMPISSGEGNAMEANPMLSPEMNPMQPNQALAPGAAGTPEPQGMWDKFGNFMGSNKGKALTYNLANILGAMGGGKMGDLAQSMAQGGMYGLRQDEMMNRQDASQNKVLAAIMGNKSPDFT